jgi:hypothetical protein
MIIPSYYVSHFLETQHCYAMQLGNTRVWDYVGDNFVHRLLQNNEDGKLVEVEGNSSGRRQQSGKQHMPIVFTVLSIQLFLSLFRQREQHGT